MQFSILTSATCKTGEIYFDLLLLTDGKGQEVAWILSETMTDAVVLSGGGYSSYTQNNVAQCIPANCYRFVITDSGGDGLCCDQGYGGYSVRLNGLKLAAGNSFGDREEVDLQCLLTPTASPTTEVRSSYPFPILYLYLNDWKLTTCLYCPLSIKPTYTPSKSPTVSPTVSRMPSEFPSELPSSTPSSSPSDLPRMFPTKACSGNETFLEVITEEDEVDSATWYIQDANGIIAAERQTTHNGGHQTTQSCLSKNACYTFIINGSPVSSSDNDNYHGLFTVRLDDEIEFSGSDFGVDHHVMFGNGCHDVNAACSQDGNGEDALFLLEITGDTMVGNLSWALLDSDNSTILSADPFGECDLNTLSMCIPLGGCYRFITSNKDGHSSDEPVGSFTVLFLSMGGSIQNYTGDLSLETAQVFLGSCYSMNFR